MGRYEAGAKVLGGGQTKRGRAKVKRVLGEYKRGALNSASGAKVRNRKQAVAIALSEARRVEK